MLRDLKINQQTCTTENCIQRLIQNLIKHLRRNFLKKQLTTESPLSSHISGDFNFSETILFTCLLAMIRYYKIKNIVKMMKSSKNVILKNHTQYYIFAKFYHYSLTSSGFKTRNLSMARLHFSHDPLHIFLYIPPKLFLRKYINQKI